MAKSAGSQSTETGDEYIDNLTENKCINKFHECLKSVGESVRNSQLAECISKIIRTVASVPVFVFTLFTYIVVLILPLNREKPEKFEVTLTISSLTLILSSVLFALSILVLFISSEVVFILSMLLLSLVVLYTVVVVAIFYDPLKAIFIGVGFSILLYLIVS